MRHLIFCLGMATAAVHCQSVHEVNPALTEVLALNDRFAPQRLDLKPGACVRFLNRGVRTHAIQPLEAPLRSNAADGLAFTFSPGERFDFCPDRSGIYVFRSVVYSRWDGAGGMIGSIVVSAGEEQYAHR